MRVGALLAWPLAWLGVAYLGSLAVLFLTAVWRVDPFTGDIVREFTLDNFRTLWEADVYRRITLGPSGSRRRDVTDALLALPIAFYMARIASPRTKAILVVAILTPLWASYLVKVYAWRIILAGQGPLNWALEPFGLTGPGYTTTGTWLVFTSGSRS